MCRNGLLLALVSFASLHATASAQPEWLAYTLQGGMIQSIDGRGFVPYAELQANVYEGAASFGNALYLGYGSMASLETYREVAAGLRFGFWPQRKAVGAFAGCGYRMLQREVAWERDPVLEVGLTGRVRLFGPIHAVGSARRNVALSGHTRWLNRSAFVVGFQYGPWTGRAGER